MKLSPKVYVPTGMALAAGLALYLLTGDKSFLLVTLTGIVGGVAGAAAPPAPGVKQEAVQLVSEGKATVEPVDQPRGRGGPNEKSARTARAGGPPKLR